MQTLGVLNSGPASLPASVSGSQGAPSHAVAAASSAEPEEPEDEPGLEVVPPHAAAEIHAAVTAISSPRCFVIVLRRDDPESRYHGAVGNRQRGEDRRKNVGPEAHSFNFWNRMVRPSPSRHVIVLPSSPNAKVSLFARPSLSVWSTSVVLFSSSTT